MNLEVLAWAPDRKTWEQAITTTLVPSDGEPLARYGYDLQGVQIMPPVLWPHEGLNIDEIGEIIAVPAIYGPPPEGASIGAVGPIIEPAIPLPGFHVNLRFHEPLADELVEGLPQYSEPDPETGMVTLLPLFERTHLLELFPGANLDEEGPAPAGYVGPKGLKLFDPALVATRNRVWA